MRANYSNNLVQSFKIFDDFNKVVNKLCQVAESSQVEYQQSKGDQKINFLDQFCLTFFNQVLLEHFQPKLLNERNIENAVIIRTTYQMYLQILKRSTNAKMILTMFYFLFGKQQPMPDAEEEDERAKDLYANL